MCLKIYKTNGCGGGEQGDIAKNLFQAHHRHLPYLQNLAGYKGDKESVNLSVAMREEFATLITQSNIIMTKWLAKLCATIHCNSSHIYSGTSNNGFSEIQTNRVSLIDFTLYHSEVIDFQVPL